MLLIKEQQIHLTGLILGFILYLCRKRASFGTVPSKNYHLWLPWQSSFVTRLCIDLFLDLQTGSLIEKVLDEKDVFWKTSIS